MANNRNDQVQDPNSSLLDSPLSNINPLMRYVFSEHSGLNLKDIKNLSQTCKKLNSIFQPDLTNINLITQAVRGEKDKVKAILDHAVKKGTLADHLTRHSTVKDYANGVGRTIEKATVLQAAVGAEDDDMVEMILSYFDKLENGRAIAQQQWQQQYPDGIPPHVEWTKLSLGTSDKPAQDEIQILGTVEGLQYRVLSNGKAIDGLIPWNTKELENCPHAFPLTNEVNAFLPSIITSIEKNGHTPSYDFSQLVTAITNKAGEEDILALFQAGLKPGSIKKGRHFNHQMLLDASKVYAANYKLWEGSQRSLFARRVYGYLQRHVSACWAQAFATGIYFIINENKPLSRCMNLVKGEKKFVYFPLDSNPECRLGFEVYTSLRGECGFRRVASSTMRHFKEYLQKKFQNLSRLEKNLFEPAQQPVKEEIKTSSSMIF